MKKIISIAVLTLAVSLIVGTVYAGTFCIDLSNACNDFKLMYKDNEGEIYEIHGYEYGCGYNNRSAHGTAKVVGSMVYIGVNGTANGTAVMQRDFVWNLDTNAVTYSYSYHTDTYWGGSGTGSIVPCPTSASEFTVDDVDEAE
jgi:hypothetical protein